MKLLNGFSHSSIGRILKVSPSPFFLNISYAGIDFSSESIKYVDFVVDTKGLKLKKFGAKEITEKDFFASEEAKNFLKEISKKSIKFAKVVVPEQLSYIFTIPLEGEIDSAREEIEFHIEENVPISLKDAVFDYVAYFEAGKKWAAVTVIASDVINNFENFLNQAGIEPISFLSESAAISRNLILKNQKGISLIAHICRDKTVVIISKDGIVKFSSVIQSGGEILSEAISKYLNVGMDQAEKIKNEQGFNMNTEDHNSFMALGNAISIIRDEIERVIIYWQTHNASDGAIEKVILSGSNALMPGLPEYLSESLRIKVEKGEAWINFPRYKDEVPVIPFKDSLSFTPSLGLFVE